MSNRTEQLTESPKLFLTDYASYNNGTQFEFGHWVELDDFSDADEFSEYITKHFKECDLKSPLDQYGSIREEPMFTDYENFPSELYSESCSSKDLEDIFEYINLSDNAKLQIEIYLAVAGGSIENAIENYENMNCVNTDNAWDWMMECNPKIQEIHDLNIPGVTINERDYFFDYTTHTASDGETYYVEIY